MIFKKNSLAARLKMIFIILVILLFVVIVAFVLFYSWASSSSLVKDKLSEVIVYSHWEAPDELSENREIFTVMTYNIGYLSGMTNNLPVKTNKGLFEKNMTALLETLEQIQPDFIGLQEVDYRSNRSYYIDQLDGIVKKCRFPYAIKAVNWDKRYVPFPYWPPSVHFGKMLSGQAVVSRRPILSAERIVLEKPGNNAFYYNAFYPDHLVQVVKIKAGTGNLVILNVHLEAFDQENREDQAEHVLNIYRSFKDDYPVLLIGDFNCVPPDAPQKKNFTDEPGADYSTDRTIEILFKEKSLKTAFPAAFTFPAHKPTRKLDYIFYNHDKIKFIGGSIPGIDSSDHLPLVMRFSLKN